jgi:1-acyl-sn-glycerol-3-phosphate acyltransferase
MTFTDRIPAWSWITFWRTMQYYHRYRVEGLERLDGDEAMLIVGYHGRPLAFDMSMLTVAIYDRYGYLPHGVVHRGIDNLPGFRWFVDRLGFVTDDGAAIAAAVEAGEHIVVTPGGGQEGCRDFRHRYQVNWGNRTGYVKLAVRHGLKIVPVAADGADDTYVGLVNADDLGDLLGVPRKWAFALWVGFGPLGPYPFSPPFPVRMRQLVGEPIDPAADGPIDVGDRAALLRVHGRVTRAVQGLLDQARGRTPS